MKSNATKIILVFIFQKFKLIFNDKFTIQKTNLKTFHMKQFNICPFSSFGNTKQKSKQKSLNKFNSKRLVQAKKQRKTLLKKLSF